MNRLDSCCFTGPRPERLPEHGFEISPAVLMLKQELRAAILDAHSEGFRFFYSGMAEGFDLFAAEAVLELRDEHELYLVAALPSPGVSGTRQKEILKRASLTCIVSRVYSPGCEKLRNIYMADHCSRIIGWHNGSSPGTAHCWRYAAQSGLELVNLYHGTLEE